MAKEKFVPVLRPGWTLVTIRGINMATSKHFLEKYKDSIESFVDEATEYGNKVLEYSSHMFIQAKDYWTKEVNGVTIHCFTMKDPSGNPIGIIEEEDSLRSAGIIKTAITDGQTRTKL